MGKEKKKNGKKGEKGAAVAAHEPVRESAVSLHSLPVGSIPAEDQPASGAPQEELKPCEEQPPPEPKNYEEPVLTQLIIESYEGEKVRGLYEGEGVAKFHGGNEYQGMFSEGLMHGKGTYTWADGVKYEGNFVKNVQMHQGRYTWPDGSVYEGQVKSGIRHGFGTYTCGTHPISYSGQWFEGKRHGKGILYYNQEGSSWYEGQFVNNVKSGWGIRCYKSGNVYKGDWERDVRHGHGTMSWLTTDQEYTGQWVDGIQHGQGIHTWYLKRIPGSQYPLRNQYVGDIVNGNRHGHGKFIFASGAVYDGEWVFNKKHGMGKLILKNGRQYEGEFIDDRLAKYPALQIDDANMHQLSHICTPSPFGTESIKVVSGLESLPPLGSTLEIEISNLLAALPEKDKQEEMRQIEFAVLSYISELRRIYTFYSSLGDDQSPDNAFQMSRLQFWRFLKDCRFHYCNVTLSDVDRILEGKTSLEEIHSYSEKLLFRNFLAYLIYLSFRIYYEEFGNMFKCFSKMMTTNVLPNACQIKGILFRDRQETVYAISYIGKCWEIYQAFCRPNVVAPHEPTMKMRHFIWMLKDLRLVNKQLTATKIVDILAKDSPCVRDGEYTSLETEIVFLEFFDALLDCAVLYVTDDMLRQQAEWASRRGSSVQLSDFSEGVKVSPPSQELSSGQSVRTSSTSSGEASQKAGDTAVCLSAKASASKIVHFVDVSKTKSKGKAEKEGKTSRRSSKSPHRERSGSIQGSPTVTLNVTFISDVMLPEEKEESAVVGVPTLPVLEEEPSPVLSTPVKELNEKLEKAKDDVTAQLSLWMSRIYIFFMRSLFENYEYLQVVKETILDNRVREAVLAEQRRIREEEEEARLYAMWEAEEARKLEEAAAEKAALELEESMIKEAEEGLVQPQSPPKEESPIPTQVPSSSKTTTAGKKKKK